MLNRDDTGYIIRVVNTDGVTDMNAFILHTTAWNMGRLGAAFKCEMIKEYAAMVDDLTALEAIPGAQGIAEMKAENDQACLIFMGIMTGHY